MKMRKELYLAIALFILIPSGSVYAQMTDLSPLGALIGAANNQNMVSETDNGASEAEEEESTQVRLEVNFEDKNYGYTG